MAQRVTLQWRETVIYPAMARISGASWHSVAIVPRPMWAIIEKFRMWLRSVNFLTYCCCGSELYVHKYVHRFEGTP
jgi:hypothetical protein